MNYTYEKNNVYAEILPEGDYELKIEKIEKRTLPNSGKNVLSLQYRIRDDVEQLFKNRVVFETIWSEKDHPEFYNRKRINKLLNTQDDLLEDGQTFEDIDDVIEFLKGANLIGHITAVMNEYRGVEENIISYYKKTKAKPEKLEDIPVSDLVDDDIPF